MSDLAPIAVALDAPDLDTALGWATSVGPYVSTVKVGLEVYLRDGADAVRRAREASGGRDYLSAVAGPMPGLRFCPTGGISMANAADYLALPNVGCVGGSWLTPKDAVAAGDWGRIERLAREAAALRG